MIQLLYSVIVGEALLILILLFKTPLRKLLVAALDRVKRGRGPVVVETVGATVFVVLLSSIFSMAKIKARTIEAGASNPTDQVLMARHMLEASLMGFMLFLSLMIDRLHYYIRELYLLRKTMEAVEKQNRASDDARNGALGKEIDALKTKVKRMESECEAKANEAKAAQANAEALKKQSEGFLLEYDRLLEDNQNLRDQLQSIDQSLSQSDFKKNL